MSIFGGDSERYEAVLYADIAEWVRAMAEAKSSERSLTDTVEKDSVKQTAALKLTAEVSKSTARDFSEASRKQRDASNDTTRTIEDNAAKQTAAMGASNAAMGGMRVGLLGLALAATPLVPVLGSLVGVVAAMPAAFGAAGLAVANFKSLGLSDIAKAQGTIEETQKKLAAGTIKQAAANKAITNATLDLSASQKAAIPVFSAWSDTMRGVAAISQQKILPAIGNLGGAIKANMGTIRASMSSSAGVIGNFIDQLAAMGKTPLFKADFATVMKSSSDSLNSFLGVARGGIKAFLGIGAAAAPFVHTLGAMSASLSQAFGSWTQSSSGKSGIQTFLSATAQSLRIVGDTFKQLGRVIFEVFAGGYESSKSLLKGINDVLSRTADFLGSARGKMDVKTFWSDIAGAVRILAGALETLLPYALHAATVLYAVGKAVVGFVGPAAAEKIIAIALAFKVLSPAISAVSGALALLAANPVAAVLGGIGIAGYLAYTKIKPFHDEVTRLAAAVQADWPQMRATALAVFASIQVYANRVVSFFQAHWPEIQATARQVWAGFKAVWETDGRPAFALISDLTMSVVNGIRNHWPQIAATARAVWTTVAAVISAAKPLIQANMDAIALYFRLNKAALDAIKPAASIAFNGLLAAIRLVAGGIQGILGGINAAIGGVAKAIGGLVTAYDAVKNLPGSFGSSSGSTTGRYGVNPPPPKKKGARTGASILGAYGSDDTLVWVTGSEFILNPAQVSMVDSGLFTVAGALAATGAPTIQSGGGYRSGAKPKSGKLSLAPKDISGEIVNYNHTIETLVKKLAGEQAAIYRNQQQAREIANEKRNLAQQTPPIAPTGGRKHDPQGYAEYERERANYRQFQAHRKAEELKLSNEQAKLHQQIADENRQMRKDRHQLSVAKSDLRKLQRTTSKAPNFPAFDSQLTTLLDALGQQTSVLGPDGNLSQGSPQTLGQIVSLIQGRVTTLKGYLGDKKYKPFITAIQDELRTDEQNLGQYRKQQFDASAAPADTFNLNTLLDAGGYTRALAAAGLTDDTGDDVAALGSEKSFLESLLSNPAIAGSNADYVTVATAIAGVNQQLASITGGSGQTADQAAQVTQLQQQLATQTRAAGLSDATVRAFGSSGDIGSGGYGSAYQAGGSQVNIYTLHPGDPQTLAAVADAANAGNGMQQSISSGRTQVMI